MMDQIYASSYSAPQQHCDSATFVKNVYTVLSKNIDGYDQVEADLITKDLPAFVQSNFSNSAVDTALFRKNMVKRFGAISNLNLELAALAFLAYEEPIFSVKIDSLADVVAKLEIDNKSVNYDDIKACISVAKSSYAYWDENVDLWMKIDNGSNPGGRIAMTPRGKKVIAVAAMDLMGAAYGAATSSPTGPGALAGAVLGAVFTSGIGAAGFIAG